MLSPGSYYQHAPFSHSLHIGLFFQDLRALFYFRLFSFPCISCSHFKKLTWLLNA